MSSGPQICYPRETSRPPRNAYDGEPWFCAKCHLPLADGGGVKSGSCLMPNDQFETCEFETREAAMERRAHWLLKAEFDKPYSGGVDYYGESRN